MTGDLPAWVWWIIAMVAGTAFVSWLVTGRFVYFVGVMLVGGAAAGLVIFFGSIIEVAWRARRKS